jgi:Tol biopolymer transport system component
VPIAGGLPSTIATVEEFAEATWGSQDVIVFTKGLGSPLYQVPAAGGAVRALTKIEFPLDVSHRAPSFLPDGKTMVFSIEIGSGRWNLAIASLDGRVTKLGQAGLRPQYLRGDRILFSTLDGIVNVVPFDPGRRVVTGSAVAVLDVDTRPDGSVSLGASESGTIAYIRARRLSAVVYISALGDVQTVPMEPRRMRHPRLSPDGNRIVAEVLSGANSGDIWSYDLKAKTFTRLTFDGHSSDPIWTPDGKRIAYTRLDSANGSAAIRGYWLAADGSGSPELLVGGASASWPTAFTPDGHTLVFDEATSINVPMHVSAMTVGKNDARQIIASTQFGNRLPALSPDGRWIAYTTGETGRQEVFVRPFDTTARVGAGKWQVSTAGGTDAVWARDGRTLFYRDGTHVIAVMVHTVPTFTVINRRSIVDDHFIADLGVNMDAAPNGKLVALSPAEAATELSVVVNWLNEVDRRLGQKK